MRSQTPYSEVPGLLAAFAPEYKKQSFHLHGRNIQNWDSLISIFYDDHNEYHKFVTKVLKGALVGFSNGILIRHFLLKGPKRFELDRIYALNKAVPFFSPVKGYTAYGAFLGASWYFIKDQLCLPHGKDTWGRTILAYSLLGGVFFGTFVHPVNFIYGCASGAIFGGFYENIHQFNYPRNFELKMKDCDEEKRARLLREDEQYEMSLRNVLSVRPNLYPL